MAESIQEIFKRKLVTVGFERTMGLLGATTLGIGALMGAGIYVLFGDLTFIVKSANFCFMVSLLPASLALRKLYRSSESSVPPNLWKRHIPEAAFISNLLLLITLDLVSIIFGLHLMALGFVIYLFFSASVRSEAAPG